MTTAIVIGASTGIGREIALQLSTRGVRLGLGSRDYPRLQEISESLGADNCVVCKMDISKTDEVREGLGRLRAALGSVDTVYLVAGTGYLNTQLEFEREEQTVAVNCLGFVAVAVAAVQIFREQGHGHFVAVTSVAAVRPSGDAPAYGPSKSFGSSYVEALRYWASRKRLPLFFTEVRPGFVETAMMKAKKPFWVVSPAVAAEQIIKAADRRTSLAYVPRRWWWVAQLLKAMPNRIFLKLG